MANNPYENKWTKSDRIGTGGQGLTHHAKSNPDDGKSYALKLLKEQRNQERRERMFVEVTALQILQHPNIPKYFDSNAANYTDNAEDFYLITEYIPGQTLQGILQIKRRNFIDLKNRRNRKWCYTRITSSSTK
jgi:eukaryotic-like serine/threonine-protein kinase